MRKTLSKEFIKKASESILKKAQSILPVDKLIFIYVSMQGEVDTASFLKEYKRVCVPRCEKGKIMEAVTGFSSLKKSPFGVEEPVDGYSVDDIYGAIIPGLAFTENMDRIGFGAGYYDRFLNKHGGIKKVAVCFDFQIRDDFSSEPHDVKMDYIVTEKRIIKGNWL